MAWSRREFLASTGTLALGGVLGGAPSGMSAGTANPALTVTALTLRLADHLRKVLL